MRLILTTLIAAFMVFLVILTTRIWGQGQTFVELKHDYFGGSQPFVIVKTSDFLGMEQAISHKADVILWLDTRISADKEIFILPKNKDMQFISAKKQQQENNANEFAFKGNKLARYSWSEIQEFYKDVPTLKEVYKKFPQQRFIVNIIDNTEGVNDAVINTLKETNSDNRTLIQSDTLVIMTSIKESKPEWLYGTSQADLMRMMSFDSMWILPATQFKGDVYIAPFLLLKRPTFNDDIIQEMKRRHKKIFLGPIFTREQFNEAQRLGAVGYITENLPELLQWLDHSQAQ